MTVGVELLICALPDQFWTMPLAMFRGEATTRFATVCVKGRAASAAVKVPETPTEVPWPCIK